MAAGCGGGAPGPGSAAPGGPAGGEGGEFLRRIAPFPVVDSAGATYAHPFLGGFDVPRPQLVDIDGDGDLDLFVQERPDEVIFLENVGTAAAPEFVWRTDRYRELEVGEWNRFADLDGDGDLDLLAERRFSRIRYYRNEGTRREPAFVPAVDSLRDVRGEAIFSDRQNIPSIADIDCDSLPDLFLGRVDGTITRYERADADGRRGTAAGEPGDPGEAGGDGAPRFVHVTDRFQGIEIVGRIGPGPGPAPRRRPGSLHGANSMAWADVEGDGDLDLFWGDFFEPSVLLVRNEGSCSAPALPGEPVPLPAGGELSTSGYNVPVPADLDADGDLDLLVGVLGGAFGPNSTAADNLWFFERVDEGGFELRTRRYLKAIDAGSESVPAVADLDGDGDADLLLGSRLDPRVGDAARLRVFENDGAAGRPSLRLAPVLGLGPGYHFAPAPGDLDGDGDPDLLLGTWNRGIFLVRNESRGGRLRLNREEAPIVTLPRGSNATPTLGDLDGDGDLDLLVGEASGTLNRFRNDGTPGRPRFTLVSEEFLGVDVGRRSDPALVDLDGDGDLDLLVGRESGGVLLLRNEGTPREPAFREDPAFSLPLPPISSPAPGDLDGDGDLDLVSGGASGGLLYFEGR